MGLSRDLGGVNANVFSKGQRKIRIFWLDLQIFLCFNLS